MTTQVIVGIILMMVFITLLILVLFICSLLAKRIAKPRIYTTQETITTERKNGLMDQFDQWNKTQYAITSYDGYQLGATYICNKNPQIVDGREGVVIISHGHTWSRYGSLKYAEICYELGYHVVIYDDRGHGENKPQIITLGYREQKDLNCVIDDTRIRYGKNLRIGLHGESMGSAISALVLGKRQDLEFAILDCGFADGIGFTKVYVSQQLHLPRWTVDVANIFCKINYHFSLKDIQPAKALEQNKVPLCIVHGKADALITCDNSEQLAASTSGYSEVHLFEKAGHAQCYMVDPIAYRQLMTEFIQKSQEQYNKKERSQ